MKNHFSSLALFICMFFTVNPAQADLSEDLAEVLRDIHPSFLAANLTGEQLARNAPVIRSRLRATRQAIEDLAAGRPTRRTTPFEIIQDPSDRRQLLRHIKDLEYLMSEVELSTSAGERQEFARAIQSKLAQIDRIYVKWTGNAASGQPVTGPWLGWGQIILQGDAGRYEGTYTDTYDKSAKGKITLEFKNNRWQGTWSEPKIGRDGVLYNIEVSDQGRKITGLYDTRRTGGKRILTGASFRWVKKN